MLCERKSLSEVVVEHEVYVKYALKPGQTLALRHCCDGVAEAEMEGIDRVILMAEIPAPLLALDKKPKTSAREPRFIWYDSCRSWSKHADRVIRRA